MSDENHTTYGDKHDRGPVAIKGNVGRDGVELSYTPQGKPVARFSVGETERHQDADGKWVSGETVWHNVVVFQNGGAEHVAESLRKGSRVVVLGRVEDQEVTKDGIESTRTTVLADEVAASMRWAPVEIVQPQRSAGREATAIGQ